MRCPPQIYFFLVLVTTLASTSSQGHHDDYHLSEGEYDNADTMELIRTTRDVTSTWELNNGEGPKLSTDPIPGFEVPKEGITRNPGQKTSRESNYEYRYNDPGWKKQWYMQDYRTANGPVMDLNLVPVYNMGITGRNIRVAVVDSGIVIQPDIQRNILESMSYNYVKRVKGTIPYDEPEAQKHTSHGTLIAGVIAMVPNNRKCGVGIAFDAKVIDVKIMDNNQRHGSDAEAKGLVHMLDKVDVYACPWGPINDGQTMFPLAKNVADALFTGNAAGRNGAGAIYVFSSGEGKDQSDNCAADAHVNSPFTLAFAGATYDGHPNKFSEQCSAIIATVYNAGASEKDGVVSTDLGAKCKTMSNLYEVVPIASGIIALLLQAKVVDNGSTQSEVKTVGEVILSVVTSYRELTFRDVQHIIVRTAEVAPLADNAKTWYRNGAGFWVSNDFGFGLLNAKNMVTLANSWDPLPKEASCIVNLNFHSDGDISVADRFKHEFFIGACQEKPKEPLKGVHFLETLSTEWTIDCPFRGSISITLVSPQNTRTTILPFRPRDKNPNLSEWRIKTLHYWGENPKGNWQIWIDLKNPEPKNAEGDKAYLKKFRLGFRGTTKDPQPPKPLAGGIPAPKGPPRIYSAFRIAGVAKTITK